MKQKIYKIEKRYLTKDYGNGVVGTELITDTEEIIDTINAIIDALDKPI